VLLPSSSLLVGDVEGNDRVQYARCLG
jgi:hypothetical protein